MSQSLKKVKQFFEVGHKAIIIKVLDQSRDKIDGHSAAVIEIKVFFDLIFMRWVHRIVAECNGIVTLRVPFFVCSVRDDFESGWQV